MSDREFIDDDEPGIRNELIAKYVKNWSDEVFNHNPDYALHYSILPSALAAGSYTTDPQSDIPRVSFAPGASKMPAILLAGQHHKGVKAHQLRYQLQQVESLTKARALGGNGFTDEEVNMLTTTQDQINTFGVWVIKWFNLGIY